MPQIVGAIASTIAGSLLAKATGTFWWVVIALLLAAVVILALSLRPFPLTLQRCLPGFEAVTNRRRKEVVTLAVMFFLIVTAGGLTPVAIRAPWSYTISGRITRLAEADLKVRIFLFEFGSPNPNGFATTADDSGYFTFHKLRQKDHIILVVSERTDGSLIVSEFLRMASSSERVYEFPTPTRSQQPLGFPRIYFAVSKHEVTSSFKRRLAVGIESIPSGLSGWLLCEGNTDTTGSSEYNQRLGLKRAKAVRRELRSLGMTAASIVCVSWGETNPSNTGNDEDAFSENRRVEIIFVESEKGGPAKS